MTLSTNYAMVIQPIDPGTPQSVLSVLGGGLPQRLLTKQTFDGDTKNAKPITSHASFAVLRHRARIFGEGNGLLRTTGFSSVKCGEIPGYGRVVDLFHTRSVPVHRQKHLTDKRNWLTTGHRG